MNIGLSHKELMQMRADVQQLLPDTCNLLTATTTSDGQGGATSAWGTATRNVSCRVDQISGSEHATDGSQRAFVSTQLALPYDTEITEAYRVEYNGNTYHVLDANPDQSWQVEKIVLLERLS